MSDVASPTIIAAVLSLVLFALAIALELRKRKQVGDLLRLHPDQVEAAKSVAAAGNITPLLVGVAIVALGYFFYSLNHVDRSIASALIESSPACKGASVDVPRQALSGETVQVTISGVSNSCRDLAAAAGLALNGAPSKETFSRQPQASSSPPFTYEAWLPSVQSGSSDIRVLVPDRTPILMDWPVSIGQSSDFIPKRTKSAPISTIITKNGTLVYHASGTCSVDLYYPNAVPAGHYFKIEAHRVSGACGTIADALLLDPSGSTDRPVGQFYDGEGPYVRWYRKVDGPSFLTVEFIGADKGAGTELNLFVKNSTSFSDIASYAKNALAALTALLGVLVTVVGYLRGSIQVPTP
jgi:hypothetical protein